jgi:hypothetical protein
LRDGADRQMVLAQFIRNSILTILLSLPNSLGQTIAKILVIKLNLIQTQILVVILRIMTESLVYKNKNNMHK